MVNEKHIEDSKLLKKENLFELFFCYAWIMLFIYMVIRPIINSGSIIDIYSSIIYKQKENHR